MKHNLEAAEQAYTTRGWKVEDASNGWIDYICPRCGYRNNMDVQCYPRECRRCGLRYPAP